MKTTLLFGMLLLTAPALAALELPSIIGENMVLQRQTDAPLWGWDQPGISVKVSFRDKTVQATTDPKGKWEVKIPTGQAGGPFPLTIEGSSKIELKNVLVGEVWIAGGQSNMWWHLRNCKNADQAIAAANCPTIRLWDANTSPKQSGYQADAPQNNVQAKWQVCTPAMIAEYPAVPYYFARQLQKELNVPVGIVHVAIPGSAIEPFFSPDYIAANGLKTVQFKDKDVTHEIKPGVSWNGTVYPAVPFAARGFIWWQGEGNQRNPDEYRTLFPGLIQDWRKAWNLPDAPFLFVELHGFGPLSKGPVEEASFPVLRDAQRAGLKLPHTAMIGVLDILEEPKWDIHPPRKEIAADRLARAALHLAYDRNDLVWCGPTVKNVAFKGEQAVVTYDNIGGGLEIKGPEGVTGFALAGQDRKWSPAQVQIKGNQIMVTSPSVKQPVALRYNFVNQPPSNLYNREGLSAAQYRTDDWPLNGK